MSITSINIQKANQEIITQEAMFKGFEYNGNNLDTFEGWRSKGYVVRRGQKAFIKTHLFTQGKNRRKILEYLFTDKQVEMVRRDELVVV